MNEIATMNAENNSVSSELPLEPFFAPRGVAVIGASPKPGNLGKCIIESLHAQGFKGRLSTVHPKGLPMPLCESITSIQYLPDITDLAIAVVSAPKVLELIQPLADRGIHNLIVIGGGFAETGEEGQGLQSELKKLSKIWNVRMIGPNCLGTFSAPDRFNSFFLSPDKIQLPGCGPIAIMSQSGAFMSSMLDQLATRGLGVHRAINFGNRIDIGECEMLQMFAADPAVKVIGVYLESIQDGQRFFNLSKKICKKKPIVIYKGGKAEKGNRATLAHSASLAGSYSVFQAVCDQAGVIEVQGLSELVNALHVLSLSTLPQGDRVLIASNGGGIGVLLTDLCEQGGCAIKEPPLEIQQELKKILPTFYSFKNPIDITGSGTNEQCIFAVDKLLKKKLYDCLLLVTLSGTEGINANIASQLRSTLPEGFPVILGAYGKDMYLKLCSTFQKEGVPVFPSGEEAAWAVNLLVRVSKQKVKLKKNQIEIVPDYKSPPLKGWLDRVTELPDEMQLKLKLSECGVQIPQRTAVTRLQDIESTIKNIEYPMILKVVGKNIQHKTELKGIRSDLFSENEFWLAWKEMNKIWPGQIWAEEQMPPGLDLMIGMNRDIDFGPVLLFGTGGKYVEVYQDIKRIILPATDDEILQAVLSTRAGKIIEGVRGGKPLSVKKLLGFIKLIAEWVEEEPKVLSLDFNPARLYHHSLVVLDAKMAIDNNFRGGM